MGWKKSDLESFHEDAKRLHEEYDALARDIIKTLPEEEWPKWVRNRMHNWVWGPTKPVDWTPKIDKPGDETFPEDWTSKWKISGVSKWAWNPFKKEPESTPKLEWDAQPPVQPPLGRYPVPPEGLPYFISPEGEITVGGPGSSHYILFKEVLRPQGLDPDPQKGWKSGRLGPQGFWDYEDTLRPDDKQRLLDAFRPYLSKIAAAMGIPANYTPTDPLDLQGKMPLINAMHVDWQDMHPEQAKQIIINAFRATMLSPRMNLKSNAILYQSLMDIPAEESNPDVFEGKIRQLKSKWDQQGQTQMGQDPDEMMSPKDQLPGKFMPGFWGNIRRLAALGPYVDQLYNDAMEDMQHGGTGELFRQRVLALGIPGVQAKVASFAWLALAPNTSELATVDVHMMRHLNQDGDSPRNTKHYLELENQLRTERNNTYGTEVPLSHYQWGVWDARRTPGYHQDHTPLKAYQPTPFQNIAWPNTARPPRPQVQIPISDDQQSLFSNWKYAGESYTIQGKIVAGVPSATTQGIAVRPDRQSQTEILGIINDLATHKDDALRQRKVIPEWALNRGGKTSDLQRGPGGVGVTYAQAVICVSEWVDVNDNWLLEHPACRGIIAEKGGAASHGVTVARERNIAIIVDASGATKINTGDNLQVDSGTAIIHVNGGGAGDFGEAQEAEVPILRFIWSQGQGETTPIPNGDPEAGVLHRALIMQQYRAGKWDKQDNALGVIYQDGKVQMMGQPSDQQAMIAWLNTIHPVTTIENSEGL